MNNTKNTHRTPYYLLGGEEAIRDLCNEFYQTMDTLPEAQAIRAMHGKDLSSIKNKLFEYLSSWLGGPDLYVEKYGSMCISTPHKPYKIGVEERDQWLLCMEKALDTVNASSEVKEMLKQPFFQVADMLRS